MPRRLVYEAFRIIYINGPAYATGRRRRGKLLLNRAFGVARGGRRGVEQGPWCGIELGKADSNDTRRRPAGAP